MASRGINKVILVGNLGADPEIRYTQNSIAIANLSIATSETWKDKQTGEQREETEWHRVVFHRRLAEVCGEYLRKGSKVYVEGRLRTRKWQGQDGRDNYTTEIVGAEMQMLDGRSNSQGGQQDHRGHAGSNQQNPTYAQGTNAKQPDPRNHQTQQGSGQPAPPDFDDDIPFAPIGKQYRGLLNAI